MRLKVWMLFLCLAALPVVALAQGAVDGKWAGEVQGGRGPQPISLTLKADGRVNTSGLVVFQNRTGALDTVSIQVSGLALIR